MLNGPEAIAAKTLAPTWRSTACGSMETITMGEAAERLLERRMPLAASSSAA